MLIIVMSDKLPQVFLWVENIWILQHIMFYIIDGHHDRKAYFKQVIENETEMVQSA